MRVGEGIAASFIVLFVTQVGHVSIAEYGVLYAIQQAVAITFTCPAAGLPISPDAVAELAVVHG